MTFHEQSVIDYLMNRRDFVPAADVSAALNVSARTVARAVKHINASNAGTPIIESRRGRGYRVVSANVATNTIGASPISAMHRYTSRHRAQQEGSGQLTSVERRDDILKTLLMSAPQKHRIESIWGKYFISDSAVSTDIRKLRVMLAPYECSVERASDVVWVDGAESNIRKAISDLISSSDVMEKGRFLQPNQLVQQRDVAFVQKLLDNIEKLSGAEISYPYSVNLFTHLYILIERYREVGVMPSEDFTQAERKELRLHPEWTEICRTVIESINQYLDAKLPEAEMYYLYQYLSSSRIDMPLPPAQPMPKLVNEVTQYLIDEVTAIPQYHDIDRDELFSSLSKHMKPLLNRLQNKIKVNNDLLGQIILEYPDLYHVVKNATLRMSEQFDLSGIDDEEVGFITVYFANAYDNASPKISIILVCTTGLGTAQLLRGKIERRFSDFNILETVAAKDLACEIDMHPETDLVVSTVGLDDDLGVPVLVVSAMLTIEDQQRLELQADTIQRHKAAYAQRQLNCSWGRDI